MLTLGYLLLGVALAVPLLHYIHRHAKAARLVLAIALVCAAAIYLIFAATSESPTFWMVIEMLGVVAYGTVALLALRGSAWWLVLGWATHPIWDVAVHHVGAGAGFTPDWYALACVSFDVVVAGFIVHRIVRARDFVRATHPTSAI